MPPTSVTRWHKWHNRRSEAVSPGGTTVAQVAQPAKSLDSKGALDTGVRIRAVLRRQKAGAERNPGSGADRCKT